MSPEDAYSILEAIAEIHGCADRLKRFPLSETDARAEETAEDIEEQRKEHLAPFSFSRCRIPVGAAIVYCNLAGAK